MNERWREALGVWGRPPDWPAWATLGIAVFLLVLAASRGGAVTLTAWLAPPSRTRPDSVSRRRYLTIVGFTAAFLSLGYVAFYLRGGPRIIDATSYFLQGRALAHGKLAWTITDPTASFRGRFLLFREPDHLGGIFPPGYPLVLALGFLIGAPMVIGPALAAGIVIATYALARELALDDRRRGAFYVASPESIARFAALLSVVCAALRYHTADTMAHGAAALGVTTALAAALHARRTGRSDMFVLAGLMVGYVAATRLASAPPIALVVAYIALHPRSRARAVFRVALGVLPGLLLLVASQRAVTGDAWTSAQRAYYAVSDGPPGCFRYGFGDGVGCVYEHGDFVRARLADGFGLAAAAGTTLRRLRMHLEDVLNLEPLALLLLVPLVRALRISRACRVAGALLVLHVLAYAPFYFDGNYPGGGARLYADVLPVEHALLAFAIAHAMPRVAFARRVMVTLALACLGFAVHNANQHEALAQRDGGRPMFEPDRARDGNVDWGLLFFDTDHGFNLAYDPTVTASHGVQAVRLRNDDRDRLLYDALGHPASHIYHFDPHGVAVPTVEAYVPPFPASEWRFEAESDWPPIAQGGGGAFPIWVTTTSASRGRVLEIAPAAGAPEAFAEIELPVPHKATWTVTPTVLLRGTGGHGVIVLHTVSSPAPLATWTWDDIGRAGGSTTAELSHVDVALEGASARLRVVARGGPVTLDKTVVAIAHR